ncbi:MAG: hydantoinase/oxoprolinase family protein [Chloroflexi bacterium]|jgi:acetone carboxylase, beta subunit|nr:hydantoinase/oxoprolinase family protein [Chloroflexota bacterium]
MAEKQYLIALDAGGTMTDTFAVDKEGKFILGKALTNHEDESKSYLESVADAANSWGMASTDLHRQALSSTYTGTSMLNALLTRRGSKVGLLITRGFAHMPIMERGLTWIGHSYEDILHQQLHEHTPWLVEPQNIKEIQERMGVGSYYMQHHTYPGTEFIPLLEEDVVTGVNELLDNGVEVIGILTIGCYTNPMHEARAAEIAREIVEKRGVEVGVVASHEICAVASENERLKTLLFQCYISEIGRKQLMKVEAAAKGEGFEYDLMTLLSYGAAANVRYPKLVEAIVSGPTGGLLGGKYMSEFLDSSGIVCADLGGTTFDAGLIAGGLLPVNKSPDFAGHRLRLPMVCIDSIGAGTGTEIHVDEATKRITLGPISAGSAVGTCYTHPDITVGDIDLILGYLNEDYFLGGKAKLNKKRALQMLEERMAKPLGQDVYEVSSKVLDLLHSDMCGHIHGMLLSKGLNPAEFTMLVYGGSGPLHAWGLDRGLSMGQLIMVPWAAAFSAFGVAAAEYFHRYDKAVTFFLTPDMTDDIKAMQGGVLSMTWQELEERGYAELEAEGISRDAVTFRHGMSCRYIGQLSNWEVPVGIGRPQTAEDVDKIIDAFEKYYVSIYPSGARYPEAGYQITEVYVEAVVQKTRPVMTIYPLQGEVPPQAASKGKRQAYMDGQWSDFDIWEMDLLEAGNRIDGPAIIEHTMTTMVIPPQNYVEFDEHKFIRYLKK